MEERRPPEAEQMKEKLLKLLASAKYIVVIHSAHLTYYLFLSLTLSPAFLPRRACFVWILVVLLAVVALLMLLVVTMQKQGIIANYSLKQNGQL